MAGATIVFCDVVGFSQHNNDEQKDIINQLNAEVTHELFPYLSTITLVPDVISLPTGDGMALAFIDREQSWKPILFCLLNRLIEWGCKNNNLRIGVHTGSISIITDINRRPNVCGATVNECQRIMDAAQPNQVLFSKEAYRQYVGTNNQRYEASPFTPKKPALFKGPVNIIAKHGLSLQVYVMYRDLPCWIKAEPYTRRDIIGKSERTKFIVKKLDELLNNNQKEYAVYEQSSYSTFGIIDNIELMDDPDHSQSYVDLLMNQRSKLDELVRKSNVTFRLIVNPIRSDKILRATERLKALVAWLEDSEIRQNNKILVVKARYEGPNRLIVANNFCVDGYKMHTLPGYEMSVVIQEKQEIDEAIKNFNVVFESMQSTYHKKDDVIAELKQMIEPANDLFLPEN